MATHTLLQCKRVGSTLNATEPLYRGGTEESWLVEHGTSGSWLQGGLVYIDGTNGKLKEVTASSAILGVAESAAAGVEDTSHRVRVIRPDDIFMMQVNGASTDTTALADVGKVFAIAENSGLFSVNPDTTEATSPDGRVKVIGIPDKTPDGLDNTIGDTYGWYYVRFIERSVAVDAGDCIMVLQGC